QETEAAREEMGEAAGDDVDVRGGPICADRDAAEGGGDRTRQHRERPRRAGRDDLPAADDHAASLHVLRASPPVLFLEYICFIRPARSAYRGPERWRILRVLPHQNNNFYRASRTQPATGGEPRNANEDSRHPASDDDGRIVSPTALVQ